MSGGWKVCNRLPDDPNSNMREVIGISKTREGALARPARLELARGVLRTSQPELETAASSQLVTPSWRARQGPNLRPPA